MCAKVMLTKYFDMKTSMKQPMTPDSNASVMKENKSKGQEI